MTALQAHSLAVAERREWLPDALRTYTWFVAGLTLALAFGLSLVEMDASTQTLVMLVLVGLIGLPHGAYDLSVGRGIWQRRASRTWWVWFGGGYLALTVVALQLWLVAPWVGLIALLVGGAVHWGADDLENPPSGSLSRFALALSRGTIPVALPLLFHPDAVASIFSVLVGGALVPASGTQLAGLIAVVIATPGVARSIARAGDARPRAAAEIGTLIVLFAVLQPVIAFAIYFCLWHSVRHSMESASRINCANMTDALRRYLGRVVRPTVLTWALAIPAWLVLDQDATPESGVWRLVFIGLFALTVPHVLLEWLDSRRARS